MRAIVGSGRVFTGSAKQIVAAMQSVGVMRHLSLRDYVTWSVENVERTLEVALSVDLDTPDDDELCVRLLNALRDAGLAQLD